jgi:hypothetical protein
VASRRSVHNPAGGAAHRTAHAPDPPRLGSRRGDLPGAAGRGGGPRHRRRLDRSLRARVRLVPRHSRRLLFTYYGLRGLSLIFLPGALTEQSGLLVFAVFYGLDWIATVPPTVRLATESFGEKDGPVVFGWIVAAHQVGAGVAALGAGVVRTVLGDYQIAFLAAGGLCLVAALLSLGVGRIRIAFPPARVDAT